MNFLRTNFLCTVIKTAILIILTMKEIGAVMRIFFFHLKRANSCVLVSIVKVGWRISIHRDLINIKDLNIFTFPYAILWLKIKSLHISSKLYYLLVQFDASDQEASINIATVTASLEHAFILFKFLQDHK